MNRVCIVQFIIVHHHKKRLSFCPSNATRQGTICTELVKRLLVFSPQLQATSAVVAELDCLMAFAVCARDRQYCRPSLVAENVLEIRGGRHPLAELVVETFIPNDTIVGSQDDHVQGRASGSDRVQVITGTQGRIPAADLKHQESIGSINFQCATKKGRNGERPISA